MKHEKLIDAINCFCAELLESFLSNIPILQKQDLVRNHEIFFIRQTQMLSIGILESYLKLIRRENKNTFNKTLNMKIVPESKLAPKEELDPRTVKPVEPLAADAKLTGEGKYPS
jgi:hypothetical protein